MLWANGSGFVVKDAQIVAKDAQIVAKDAQIVAMGARDVARDAQSSPRSNKRIPSPPPLYSQGVGGSPHVPLQNVPCLGKMSHDPTHNSIKINSTLASRLCSRLVLFLSFYIAQ